MERSPFARPSPPRYPARVNTPTRMAAGLVVATVALLALEAGARLARGARPDLARVEPLDPGGQLYAELEFHRELLWRLVPGDRMQEGVRVRVNADRMRGPATPTGRRVLFVGDSSVFGWGVPEAQAFAWSAVARAQARVPGDVVTVNAATPGYSSSQARLLLDRLIPSLQPEVVVVATLWSDMMRAPWTDRELFARFGSPEQAEALGRHDWRVQSALYAILRATLLSRRPVPAERRVLWGSILDGEPRGRARRVSPADHRAHITHIHATAQAHGARVIDLVLPTHRGADLRPPDEEIARYRANLVEVAEGSGAAWVDANDALASVPASDLDPYFIDPVHPSAKGHAAIAQALAPALVEALAR